MFAPDDRVKHRIYGVGTVLKSWESEGNKFAEIKFDHYLMWFKTDTIGLEQKFLEFE